MMETSYLVISWWTFLKSFRVRKLKKFASLCLTEKYIAELDLKKEVSIKKESSKALRKYKLESKKNVPSLEQLL